MLGLRCASHCCTASSHLAAAGGALRQSAGTLLGYLPLLLVPPAVGIMVQWQRIGADFWAIAAALVLSLLVCIPLTGALMQWLIRRQLGREGRP